MDRSTAIRDNNYRRTAGKIVQYGKLQYSPKTSWISAVFSNPNSTLTLLWDQKYLTSHYAFPFLTAFVDLGFTFSTATLREGLLL